MSIQDPGSGGGEPQASPPYAAYYRPGVESYGTPEKLQVLSEGYFGLNMVFLLNIALSLGSRAIPIELQTGEQFLTSFLLLVGVMFVIIGACTYPFNRKIGVGLGWAPAYAVLASVLMGLNSALCCGIIGYLVMQSLALKEIKRYGVTSGFFGLRKKDVEARIAQMREEAQAPEQSPWSL